MNVPNFEMYLRYNWINLNPDRRNSIICKEIRKFKNNNTEQHEYMTSSDGKLKIPIIPYIATKPGSKVKKAKNYFKN